MKTIIINGIKKWTLNDMITYIDLIELAGKEYSDYYTVTYHKSKVIDGEKHALFGILTHGNFIRLDDDMVFNIAMTGNA